MDEHDKREDVSAKEAFLYSSTALSAERYILRYRIETIKRLSFLTGVSFGLVIAAILFPLLLEDE